jgi:hypothetical protein
MALEGRQIVVGRDDGDGGEIHSSHRSLPSPDAVPARSQDLRRMGFVKRLATEQAAAVSLVGHDSIDQSFRCRHEIRNTAGPACNDRGIPCVAHLANSNTSVSNAA